MDISFIIPAHNEQDSIGKCIWSIKKAMRNKAYKYEIIVVDDASTDSTAQIVTQQGAHLIALTEKEYPSKVRNIGACKSRGEILVFLDADVILTDEWAKQIDASYQGVLSQQHITGSTLSAPETSNWIVKNWFGDPEVRVGSFINGGHIIAHRQTFFNLLGFDETLETGEDTEFCIRAKKEGVPLIDNCFLKAIHLGFPDTIGKFFRRERWHGKGNFANFDMMKSKVSIVVMALYLYLMIGIAITILSGLKAGTIWFGIIAVGVSVAFAYYRSRLTNIIPNACLSGVYLAARMVSAFDVVVDKVKARYQEMIEDRIQGEMSKR